MADQGMPSTYETTTTTSSTRPIGFYPEYIRTIPGILKIVECVLDLITFICATSVWWGHLGGGWVQFVSITALIMTALILVFNLIGLYGRLPGQMSFIVLDLVVFICATVYAGWVSIGGGWVQFVSMSGLLSTAIWFIFKLTLIINRLPRQDLLPMIILGVMTFTFACLHLFGKETGWVQFVAVSAFLSTVTLFFMHTCNFIGRYPGPWLLIEFIYYVVYSVFYVIAAIVAAARSWAHASIGATAFFAFAATAVYCVDAFFQFRAWRSGQTTQTTTHTTTTSSPDNPEAAKQVY